jgi:HK97 gp10 family phage protein
MPQVTYVGSAALMARGMAAVRPAVVQSAETLASTAQSMAPVDTGTLRASIHVNDVQSSATEVTAKVSTGGEASEYAEYQETGTSKMAAQPYMGPAVIAHGPLHKAVCEAAWKGAF